MIVAFAISRALRLPKSLSVIIFRECGVALCVKACRDEGKSAVLLWQKDQWLNLTVKSIIVATPRYGTEYFRAAQDQYPQMRLEEGFSRLLAVRGLVGNEMTPQTIQQAVSALRDRESVFGKVSGLR